VGSDLTRVVRAKLGVSYTPAIFATVAKLPRNATGKLVRDELRLEMKAADAASGGQ